MSARREPAGNVLRLLALKRGGADYLASRVVAVVTQLLLAAFATRTLSTTDLGRFGAAYATAALVGMVAGSGFRRVTLHRPAAGDLSDLKGSAVLVGAASIAAAGGFCAIAFDPRTGLIAAGLASWRAADAYGEIGQAAWTLAGNLRRAGWSLAGRNLLSTAATVALMGPIGLPEAILVGFAVRGAIAAAETGRARRQPYRRARWSRTVRTSAAVGRISTIAVAVMLVDTLPTLALTGHAGVEAAALVTPLGRIRFGVVLAATSLAEIAYPEMLVTARARGSALHAALRPLAQHMAVVAVLMPVLLAGGAALVFGSLLHGERDETLLAASAGVAMGASNIVAMALTAANRIGIQVVCYLAAAGLALAVTALAGWTIAGLYGGQAIASCLALVALSLGHRAQRVSPAPRAGVAVPAAATSAPPPR